MLLACLIVDKSRLINTLRCVIVFRAEMVFFDDTCIVVVKVCAVAAQLGGLGHTKEFRNLFNLILGLSLVEEILTLAQTERLMKIFV